MKYINEKEKLSIEVFEEYKRLPEEAFDKMGMTKAGKEQTIFMFASNNNGQFDSFNITKDAVYPTDEQAMSKGIDLNIAVLKASGANVLKEKEIKLLDGSQCKMVVVEMNKMKLSTLFKSINGLFVCMAYGYNEDLIARENNFIEIFSSLKKI